MDKFSMKFVDSSGVFKRIIWRGSHPLGVALNEPYLESETLSENLDQIGLFPVLVILEKNNSKTYVEINRN